MSSASPQDVESGDQIIFPDVPLREADPRVRINTMIGIFNASVDKAAGGDGKLDKGLFHEIWTASYLVDKGYIINGCQFSRPITPVEKKTQKGDWQMILVPLSGKHKRELDMVCRVEDTHYIVEAKNTQTVDASQLEANARLAMAQPGKYGVMYALPGDKRGQEKALREAYDRLQTIWRDLQTLPPLKVIHIPQKISDIFQGLGGKALELGDLYTGEDDTLRMDLEYDFGRHISFEDIRDYAEELKWLESGDHAAAIEDPKRIGWAQRALRKLGRKGW